jgi:hypothetical protein
VVLLPQSSSHKLEGTGEKPGPTMILLQLLILLSAAIALRR